MTITYGFYDSISSDRLYNAKQMSSIFDGLILDGVYANYADQFVVLEDTGMDVSVGSGRAWFDHTWTYNDAAIGKTIATADALLNRIDIIYLEVNENVGVRANSIDVLTGTPASSPVPPTLTQTSSIHQYALAHIYVGAGVTEILQANITDMVGTDDTPYVALVVEYETLQAQIWAIVGDTNPPLIDLIVLEGHDHDGVVTAPLADGAIDRTDVLANNIVDDTKVGNRVPQFYRRQGGSAANWENSGNTNYTPGAVRIQAGSKNWTGTPTGLGSIVVTFPVAFSDVPLGWAVSKSPSLSVGINVTTTTMEIFFKVVEDDTLVSVANFYWQAIGPE